MERRKQNNFTFSVLVFLLNCEANLMRMLSQMNKYPNSTAQRAWIRYLHQQTRTPNIELFFVFFAPVPFRVFGLVLASFHLFTSLSELQFWYIAMTERITFQIIFSFMPNVYTILPVTHFSWTFHNTQMHLLWFVCKKKTKQIYSNWSAKCGSYSRHLTHWKPSRSFRSYSIIYYPISFSWGYQNKARQVNWIWHFWEFRMKISALRQ